MSLWTDTRTVFAFLREHAARRHGKKGEEDQSRKDMEPGTHQRTTTVRPSR